MKVYGNTAAGGMQLKVALKLFKKKKQWKRQQHCCGDLNKWSVWTDEQFIFCGHSILI